MVKVTTSIKIDNEKRELAKKRGIILTDLLDQALDMALGLELKESTQLQQEKEDLLQQKEILLKEKEDFLKDHESKLLEIDFKLRNIEDALASAVVIDKEEIKEKEYKILANRVYEEGDLDRNLDVRQLIEGYADRYNMNEEEYKELRARLYDDLTNIFTNGKYQVKGSIRFDIRKQEVIYEY